MAGYLCMMCLLACVLPTICTASLGNVTASADNSTYSHAEVETIIPIDSSLADWITVQVVRYYVYLYLVPVLVAIGLVGNSLNVLVLRSQDMKISSSNTYLLALAVSDLLFMLSHLPVVIAKAGALQYEMFFKVYEVLYHVMIYTYPMFWGYSTYITVAFSVERCIAVGLPLKARSICTVRQARIVLFCLLCLIALLDLAYPLRFKPTRWFNPQLQQIDLAVGLSQYGLNPTITTVFMYLYLVFKYLIPYPLLLFSNAYLIFALLHSQRERNAKMGIREVENNQEVAITRMIVIIVCVFFFCNIPSCIFNMADLARPGMVWGPKWQIFFTFQDRMLSLNGCVNFFLYGAFSQQFRYVLKSKLAKCSCMCWSKSPARYKENNSTSAKTAISTVSTSNL